jgi:tetratricopeptide (TPR) repeat protein
LNAAVLLALVGFTASVESPHRLAFATLNNGLSVGFALVRTTDQETSARMDEVALTQSNGVSRVLIDRESGAYFGYRLVAGSAGGGRVRLAFQPLPKDVDKELKRTLACDGCPALLPLAPPEARFPPPQVAADGEAVRFELLANPKSGERIIDVVTVSSQAVSPAELRAAAGRTLEAWRATERAGVLVARGALTDAVAEYERALTLTPDDAGVESRLGACHQRLGRNQEARQHYARALELNPRHAGAWNNLGTLEHSQRRFKQAAHAYRRALDVKPTMTTAWKNLGAAQLALGRVDEGLESYRRAFQLDPASLESQSGFVDSGLDPGLQSFFVAKMLAGNGQPGTALEFLLKAQAGGFRDWRRVEQDPAFRALQDDPRFRRLLHEASK